LQLSCALPRPAAHPHRGPPRSLTPPILGRAPDGIVAPPGLLTRPAILHPAIPTRATVHIRIDIIFALFDLLGLQFAPRLAGLPDRRLYRLGSAGTTPAAQLLVHPLNLGLIRDGWDDLVRCAASLRDGTVTASLLVARLQAAGGKLPLTRALQEYGRLVKTRFVLGYLADETERRAIGRQQNKGESLHALHDRTFHGNHGTVRLHALTLTGTRVALHRAARITGCRQMG
jgi:hypothetical protein